MSLTAESSAGEPQAGEPQAGEPQAGQSLWSRLTGRRSRPRPSTRTVVVGRTPLRVAVRPGNPGTGPPLLLANGIGASLETWEPFLEILDPAIEVIRFDVPGVGGSPLPLRPYRFTRLARLVAGLLDQLGHEQADILGISWGGALAQEFALSAPARCRRVVLVATGTGTIMVPGNPWVLATLATPRRYQDPDYAHQVAGQLYGGTARREIEQVTRVLHQWTRVGPSRGYLYQLTAAAGWTSLPRLPRLRQPTLILAGNDDPIIPLVNARILARLIPNARLHVYDGGHVELVLRPDLLAPPVSQFLTEPEAPPAGR
jgi:poly(3-hydroxyalkanoate) depolymerase